ncbi:Glycosyl hydrolases family 38, C-terminal beta sandwich domain [Dillenia turbinata]|uniref:Glycosyl hydrolases family 38, C-terminal beta sandwich domain n=1 Tax=Dillenia turbinata TaxID=194707 RepID=A0AAN8V549_9MAGN
MEASYSLPKNVTLITPQELENGKVLVRLAHLYETGVDKDFSKMASVELKSCSGRRRLPVTEMSLSANQERAEMEKKKLAWKVEGCSGEEPKAVRGGSVGPGKLVVELSPMEIRTLIDFEILHLFGS